MKEKRNDECWCKSGLRYKECHFEFDKKLEALKNQGFKVPSRKLIKTKVQIEGIKESAKINNGLLDLISSCIKEGMSTEELDKLAYDYTIENGAVPAPLDYYGYPKSICTSINEVVCHGIPSEDVILKEGDIINVDVSTVYKGYFSDASRMYKIGKVSDEASKLVDITRECLYKGIEAVKPWGFLGDIGAAIQEHANAHGYSVVRTFGGHGIGLKFQEEPFVHHHGMRGTGMILVPGMMFTIEPMINEGSFRVKVDKKDGWTARTVDGMLSAQWEHTLLVTEDGVEIISK